MKSTPHVESDLRAEIEPWKRTQRAPREIQAEFQPLKTCPKEQRRRWEKRAELAATQPMKAIELKCLECCCWSRPEAARCEITRCPIWGISRRIFKGR